MVLRCRIVYGAFVVFLCLPLFFLLSCSQDPVRIGYIGSFSGKFSALGSSCRDGALLAVEERNAAGGLKGRPVQLMLRDDEGSPPRALSHAQEFAGLGLQVIIGPFITASAMSVVPYANGVPMLTLGPVIAGAGLAGIDDYFIKLYPSTRDMGAAVGKLAAARGWRSVAVLYDDNNREYSLSIIEGIRTTLSASVHSVAFKSTGIVPYADLVRKSLSVRPDAVIFIASALDTAILAQKVRQADGALPLVSSSWAVSRELIDNGGAAVEGMLFHVPYEVSHPSREYQRFLAAYRNRFSADATYCSLFNYEAVQIVLSAMEAEARTADDLKKQIVGREFSGLQGMIAIDRNGDASRPLVLHTIENRQIVKAD